MTYNNGRLCEGTVPPSLDHIWRNRLILTETSLFIFNHNEVFDQGIRKGWRDKAIGLLDGEFGVNVESTRNCCIASMSQHRQTLVHQALISEHLAASGMRIRAKRTVFSTATLKLRTFMIGKRCTEPRHGRHAVPISYGV